VFKRRNRIQGLDATRQRAEALFAAGDDHALEFIEDAVRKFPESAKLRLLLASSLVVDREDEVAAHAARAAALEPEDPRIQIRAGDLLWSQGDQEGARQCAERAEAMIDDTHPSIAALEELIGLIAANEGEGELAEEKLRSAVRREPEWPSHALALARFLWSRNRDGEALAVLDETTEMRRPHEEDLVERLRREIASGR
jgi:Tfp pilus assembly protein PilF